MSKIAGPQTSFRVTVYPRDSSWCPLDEGQMRDRCERIAAEVKRHVDDVHSAHVEFDQQEVCEHCGYPWTEVSADYNGGCCEKDQESHDAILAELEKTP